jgi:hypothetical protein
MELIEFVSIMIFVGFGLNIGWNMGRSFWDGGVLVVNKVIHKIALFVHRNK